MPMPTPAASPSQTPELYALLSELLYFSTARCSPVKDATFGWWDDVSSDRHERRKGKGKERRGMVERIKISHCRDGADGLVDDAGGVGVGGLSEGSHPGDDAGHERAGEHERRDGGEHDEREEPALREGDGEAAREGDEQLDALADFLAHGVLDEHRVPRHPPHHLPRGGPLVEERHLLPQDGTQVQPPDPRRLPLAGDHPARHLCC